VQYLGTLGFLVERAFHRFHLAANAANPMQQFFLFVYCVRHKNV
jgi:hypothetical protein